MPIAADTFVEASDTGLTAHTPTGTDAGAGWVAVGSGSASVIASTDVVQETNDSAANRHLMNNDLGSKDMVVEAVFTQPGTGTPFLAVGLIFRRDSSGGGGTEASYDQNLGQWIISDNSSSTSFTEAWPGGSVTMRVEADGGTIRLYGNGTLKVTHPSWEANGHYAGITLLNFTGGGANQLTCDNYISRDIPRYFLI